LTARGTDKLEAVIDKLAKRVEYYFKINIKKLKNIKFYLEPIDPKENKKLL